MKCITAAMVAGLTLAALTGCSSHTLVNPSGTPLPSVRSEAVTRYVGFSVPGFPPNTGHLITLERATGVLATAVSFYMSLGKALDLHAVSSLRASGVLPIVEIDSDKISLADIAAGTEDNVLKSYARQVASVHGTVAIDFDHEFNGPWFDWAYTHESAASFIAAWRHIVTIFRRNGATNVAWVWDPNVSARSTTAIRPWYPGNSWVTMIGLDGYFYSPKDTFSTVFGPTLKQVRSFTQKPIIIVETGVDPSANRSEQISDLFKGAREAGIVGLIWFDYHKHTDHNWVINGDPAALAAFRTAAKNYQ
jgi:mannan endo-1,4-beta-mannosidase